MRRSMQTVMSALAVPVALLVACTPGDPGQTPPDSTGLQTSAAAPSPAPSTSEEPTPTPTPTPSPTAQSQEEKDIAAAKKAVREANRIIDEVLMEPDKHKTYPKELEKYVDPASPYWDYNAFGLESYRAEGKRFDSSSKVVELELLGEYNEDELLIYRCTDGRKLQVLDSNGEVVSKGGMDESHMIVKKIDGKWLVWDYKKNSQGYRGWEVSECQGGSQ